MTSYKDIYDYKLYLFDLDGTIIDSEPIHWESYNKAYKRIHLKPLTYEEYVCIAHSPEKSFRQVLEERYPPVYELKEKFFALRVKKQGLNLIKGAKEFILKLLELEKEVWIVTHSPQKRADIIKKQFPFLEKVTQWIVYEDFKCKKPNPECYIKAIQSSGHDIKDCIGFEDSYKGFLALKKLMITKIFINSCPNYPFKILTENVLNSYQPFLGENAQVLSPTYLSNKKKLIDVVAIVACGKGERLKPLTDHIPKLLINIDNQNLLEHVLSYWKQFTNNFVIIVEPEHNGLISYYARNFEINYTILNLTTLPKRENSYTIQQTLGSNYFNKRVLITWCDIYPDDKIPLRIFKKKSNIIFTYGNQCRYQAEKNLLQKEPLGNVIGIYYFPKYQGFQNDNYTLDICDIYVDNYPEFDVYELKRVNDIGEMKKLNQLIEDHRVPYQTHYFNQISEIKIKKKTALLKESICPKGDEIIEKEKTWYGSLMAENIKINVPAIYQFGINSFRMEKLNATPIYQFFSSIKKDAQKRILNEFIDSLIEMHQHTKDITPERIQEDLEIEFYSKIQNRIEDVKDLLLEFSKITHINNLPIKLSFDQILKNIYTDLQNHFKDRTEYSFLHGDCQFSNTMYNFTHNKLYFIDPRGYFGKSKIYGLSEYDYGKVLYSLSGYDSFNNDPKYYFRITQNKTKINLETNIVQDWGMMSHLLNLVEEKVKIPKKVLIDILIINWFGLAQYNKNNILKCVASYYQAIYLYHLYYFYFGIDNI